MTEQDKMIQDLRRENENLKRKLEDLEKITKWIEAEETLPEKNVQVLVCFQGVMSLGMIVQTSVGTYWYRESRDIFGRKIADPIIKAEGTVWRSLPDPYTGESV